MLKEDADLTIEKLAPGYLRAKFLGFNYFAMLFAIGWLPLLAVAVYGVNFGMRRNDWPFLIIRCAGYVVFASALTGFVRTLFGLRCYMLLIVKNRRVRGKCRNQFDRNATWYKGLLSENDQVVLTSLELLDHPIYRVSLSLKMFDGSPIYVKSETTKEAAIASRDQFSEMLDLSPCDHTR